MNMNELLDSIKNKSDFIEFIYKLKDDKINKESEWENIEIETYLEAIASWTEDMEGYYYNVNRNIPTNIDWSFIATLLYVGKIYE